MKKFLLAHGPSLVVLLSASVLLCFNVLLIQGRPTTFDGHIHVTTMVQFAESFRSGEFPAWSQGFANYGYPLAIFAHQLPAYAGALLLILGFSPENIFSILIVVSTVLSGWGMYAFLTSLLKSLRVSVIGGYIPLLSSLFWIFSSYRITNIYSRGALPELIATAILPFLLLSILTFKQKQTWQSMFFVSTAVCALILTHPMMFVLAAPLLLATILTLGVPRSIADTRWLITLGTLLVLGVAMGGYYILPLVLELKYVYQGNGAAQISDHLFLTWNNLFVIHWPYFPLADHPGPRLGPMQIGLFEGIMMVVGVCATIFTKLTTKKWFHPLLIWSFTALLSFGLVLRISKPLYDAVPILTSLQFPWRFLLSFQFCTSVIAALVLTHIPRRFLYLCALGLLLIIAVRLPEAYGKNFVSVPFSEYQFNRENLHSTNMNPIWVGETGSYPVMKELFTLVEGSAQLQEARELPSTRSYRITVASPSRISFNTFYFPGWELTVDEQSHEIEYQDQNFRGVMTTRLEPGQHYVVLQYRDTKTRRYAKYVSVAAVTILCLFLVLEKRNYFIKR